jgi:23S rRNA pseudouridine1911/1915/1917 synthase
VVKKGDYNRPLSRAAATVPAPPLAPDKAGAGAPGEAAAEAPAEAAADAPGELRLTLPADAAGLRFDQALARALPEYSRSRLRQWIEAGRVTSDGLPADPTRKVRGDEYVAVLPLADPSATTVAAEAIALTVVHEDAALIVVDKPAGLVTHPGSGNWAGTLQNALLHFAPELGAVPRAGIVHRLDKDTSGLLVVGRTLQAQTDLVRQLQARTVHREYLALAAGDVARGGTVDAPIGRHPTRRTTMAVVATGRPARTHYAVVERFGNATLLSCRLETGRTHQIRVHLASLGHPLVGDPAYGRKGPLAFGRQALHAFRLGLLHPVTRAACAWESPLPADFAALLERLRAGKVTR